MRPNLTEMKKPYIKPGYRILKTRRRRSERVTLRVAVLLRTETMNGNTPAPQAFTQVVNAHGGLLESPVTLLANQETMLVNPQIGQEAKCRILRTERLSPEKVATAFEFCQPTPQFWPLACPPADWNQFAT